jgi:hypothetical protein
MMSWDKDLEFDKRYTFPDTDFVHDHKEKSWSNKWDSSLGNGQTVYILESGWPSLDREEVGAPWICHGRDCHLRSVL